VSRISPNFSPVSGFVTMDVDVGDNADVDVNDGEDDDEVDKDDEKFLAVCAVRVGR
jgi:hypothetical protein